MRWKSQLATVFASVVIALEFAPSGLASTHSQVRQIRKDPRYVHPHRFRQAAMDRCVGIQPGKTTKKWDTAAYPGLRILRSEFAASEYIGTEHYLFRGRQIEN